MLGEGLGLGLDFAETNQEFHPSWVGDLVLSLERINH